MAVVGCLVEAVTRYENSLRVLMSFQHYPSAGLFGIYIDIEDNYTQFIRPGDSMWYDSTTAYWTPQGYTRKDGNWRDVEFDRVGYAFKIGKRLS